ncbi:MAG: hypothetical protein DYH08_13010, partial [Actinobacteria bacterium ATB1]|nr:hypothetical protein [Actinobacteria bacterium ATB1]
QHPAAGKHLQDLRAPRPTRGELLAAAAWTRAQDPSDGFRSLLVATLESLDITDASDVLD